MMPMHIKFKTISVCVGYLGLLFFRQHLDATLSNNTEQVHQSRHPFKPETLLINEADRPHNISTCPPFPAYNFTICTYPTQDDIFISGHLNTGVMWEKEMIYLLQSWLRRDRSLSLIDIGANLGVFSLVAAGMGHKVLAVEPMLHHQQKLRSSIALSGHTDLITVMPYAVSDGHYNMSLRTSTKNGGFTELTSSCTPSEHYLCTQTRTIMLDDLLEISNFGHYHSILKIDIEGHEMATMMAGHKFWQVIQIPAIFMEWGFWGKLKERFPRENVMLFLESMDTLGYKPYNLMKMELNTATYKEWPVNIIWAKKDFLKTKHTI